jgi:hypothetical protein
VRGGLFPRRRRGCGAGNLRRQGFVGCIVVTGLALGSETDALSYLTARYFGMRAYGEIATLFAVGIAVGNGLGPFAISRLREASGGYEAPFLVVAG